MASQKKLQQGTATCTLDVGPNPVDAGAEFTVTAAVICDPACDLTGDTLTIRDAEGAEIGILTFDAFDEESATSAGTVSLNAPAAVGDYAWTAELPAFTADDLAFDAVVVPVALSVKAHSTRVTVWDAPTAIGVGEPFAVKVGVKCTCGCALAGQPFTVHDASGAEIAAGTMGAEVFPSTAALYFADVALTAPAGAAAGTQTWTVRFPVPAVEPLHVASEASFGVTFVSAPEHVVVVEALDGASQAPLPGALVTMHPYRAIADEKGVAKLRVPKGDYTLFVSARKYVSDRAAVTITGDLKTQAHLAVEVRPERI